MCPWLPSVHAHTKWYRECLSTIYSSNGRCLLYITDGTLCVETCQSSNCVSRTPERPKENLLYIKCIIYSVPMSSPIGQVQDTRMDYTYIIFVYTTCIGWCKNVPNFETFLFLQFLPKKLENSELNIKICFWPSGKKMNRFGTQFIEPFYFKHEHVKNKKIGAEFHNVIAFKFLVVWIFTLSGKYIIRCYY